MYKLFLLLTISTNILFAHGYSYGKYYGESIVLLASIFILTVASLIAVGMKGKKSKVFIILGTMLIVAVALYAFLLSLA